MILKECHRRAVKEEANKPRIKKHNRNKHDLFKPKLISEHLSREDEELLENILPKFELATVLKKMDPSTLPPSLMPPTFKDFIDYNINTW